MLSVDPVTAYQKPITNFCRYCYARNNPYKFVDPDGRDVEAYGDSGYTGADKREELQGVDVAFRIAEKSLKLRAMKNKRARKYAERWEQFKASVWAKVEHPFRVVKRQIGYTKARYRGLAKNAAQVLTLSALSNLWMARRRLLLPAV